MKSFRHTLPPLNCLLTFESAARHSNFTRAAYELHVTQAAVSRQVKQLEQYLGVSLFERPGRRVELTPTGHRLSARVKMSLDFLVDAIGDASRHAEARLTLAANTAMSHLWLGPKLTRYRNEHRDTQANLRIIASDISDEILSEDVDIAIVYDMPERPGWRSFRLFKETLYPVAAPSYLAVSGPIDGLEQLRTQALLDFDRIEPNWVNWAQWFRGLGEPASPLNVQQQFNNYNLVLDAALDGHGIALGTHRQVSHLIRRGSLVRVGHHSLSPGRAYWLAVRQQTLANPEALALVDWLLSCGHL